MAPAELTDVPDPPSTVMESSIVQEKFLDMGLDAVTLSSDPMMYLGGAAAVDGAINPEDTKSSAPFDPPALDVTAFIVPEAVPCVEKPDLFADDAATTVAAHEDELPDELPTSMVDADDLMGGLFLDDNVPSIPVAQLVAQRHPKKNKHLCTYGCQKPRAPSQNCCDDCHTTSTAAGRHAGRQGAQHVKSYKDMKRIGGPAFKTFLDDFKRDCLGYGRGTRLAPFDYMAYAQNITVSTKVDKGERQAWQTKWFYVDEQWKHHRTKEADAITEWDRLRATLPSSRVDSTGTKLLLEHITFVDTVNSRSHNEVLTTGHKPEKKVTPHDWSAAISNMGSDHHNFSDPAFCRTLGLGADALNDCHSSVFSNPSRTLAESQKLAIEAADEAKREKDAARAAAAEKRQFRRFEPSAVLGAMRPTWLDKSHKLQNRFQECIADCREQIDEIKANETLERHLSESTSTLELRMRMLQAILGSEAATSRGEGKAEWEQFKNSEEVKAGKQLLEPHPHMENFCCWQDAHKTFTTLMATTWEEHAELKERLQGLYKTMSDLVTHVKAQCVRVKGLVGKKERLLVKEAETRASKASKSATRCIKATVKQSARQRGSMEAVVEVNTITCKVFDSLGQSVYDGMPRVEVKNTWTPSSDEAFTPCLVSFTDDVCAGSMGEAVTAFGDRFRTDPLYASRKRASVICRGALSKTKCPVTLQQDRIRGHIGCLDQNYLDACWFYGNTADSASCGPESLGLCSVKYVHQGSRHVLAAPYDKLSEFVRSVLPEGASMTMAHCAELLRDADTGLLANMTQFGVPMLAAVVRCRQAIYIPGGWVTAERIDDGDLLGLRWTPIWDVVTAPFTIMSSAMLPSNGENIANNSTAMLLAKVCLALQRSASGEQRAMLTKKIKQEILNAALPVDITRATEPLPSNAATSSSSRNGQKRPAEAGVKEEGTTPEPKITRVTA